MPGECTTSVPPNEADRHPPIGLGGPIDDIIQSDPPMTPSSRTLWIRDPLACPVAAAAGGVVVSGARIVAQVPAGGPPRLQPDPIFDASEHLLLPGAVNTHHHFYQTLTRSYSPAHTNPLLPR